MQPVPVTIQLSSLLCDYSGGAAQISLLATDVRAVLEELERRHPSVYRGVCNETGAVRPHVNMFVNTNNVRDLQGLDTSLESGDIVTILQAVSGG